MTEQGDTEPGFTAMAWLPWAGLLVLIAPVVGHIALALPMLVVALLIAALAWQVQRPVVVADLLATRRTWALGLLALPGGLQLTEALRMPPSGLRLLAVFSYAGLVSAVLVWPRVTMFGRVTIAQVWILLQMVLFVAVVQVNAPNTDVWVFLTDGARAVVHGVNPYALTFPNIYPDRLAHLFYGSGVVVDNRVVYGFPYTPPSALWAVVGYVFGDVRFSGAIALGVLSMTLSGATTNQRSRVCAVLFLVAPSTVPVLMGAWTEASVVVLLALTIWTMRAGRLMAASILLGLFLVSKQYIVVTLPCLWLLRGLITRRHLAVVAVTALGLTVPFVLVNPHAFWRSVVEWQFIQPFRADSLSLLAPLVTHTGWPSPAVYGVLPLAAGLLAASIFALKVQPGPAQYASGVGLALLTTVLLSKQAFLNYYFLIGGALLIAAWAAGSSTLISASHSHSAAVQSPHDVGSVEARPLQPDLLARLRHLTALVGHIVISLATGGSTRVSLLRCRAHAKTGRAT